MKRAKALSALAVVIALCVLVVPAVVMTRLSPPGLTASPLPYEPLTIGSYNDVSPAWSPDGKTIAFASDRNGGWEIWVMKPDGQQARELTPSSYVATNPSWSPDSSKVAFWTHRGSRTGISVAFVSNSTILTVATGNYSVVQGQPQWSPDGTRLLFMVSSNGTQLASTDLSSGSSVVVAGVSGEYASATWVSPTRVAYSSLVNGSYEIDRADVVSGGQGFLQSGNANYTSPSFSSNASKIAYISDLVAEDPWGIGYPSAYQEGDFNLWTSDLDGSNTMFQSGPAPTSSHGRTPYPAAYSPGTISPAQVPAWRPDGGVIAYVASSQPTGSCIFLWDVVNSYSSLRPIGPENASVSDLSWSPDNVSLAFSAMSGGFRHIFVIATEPVPAMPVSERNY